MDYNFNYNFGGIDFSSFGVELAALSSVAIILLIIIGIAGLVVSVLQIIGTYKLLKKANKHPVGAFIPFVAQFQFMELTGMEPWWLLIVMCASFFIIVPLLGVFCLAIVIYYMIVYCSGIAKSYGKDSIGFIVGLVLLHPIFIFILGIGPNDYIGIKPANDILFNREGKVPTK